ncbi:MAG: DMT family transporter [Leptolyngbya sp. SIO4C1]|nr:DMT family transporter [Leptolyngbya sp. SIO4C1]
MSNRTEGGLTAAEKVADVCEAGDAKIRGAAALALALVGIASASILLVIAEQEISPYAATFDRLSLAAVLFFFWAGRQRLSNRTSSKAPRSQLSPELRLSDAGLLLMAGLAFSTSLTLWAWSLSQTSVANSTLLNNMMPIFTTLGAWVVFNQTFSRKFLLGMGIAIAGALLIGVEDLQVADGLAGDAAALAAALLSAVNILCIGQLRQRFATPWIMLWTSLIGSCFLAIVLWGLQDQAFPHSATGWLAVIALALLSQALGQGLLTYCLKQFSAGFVAVSMLTIPVLAAVAALICFGERLSWLNWAAFGIVLLGVYLAVSAQDSDDAVNRVTVMANKV